jgi:hypothetical protein
MVFNGGECVLYAMISILMLTLIVVDGSGFCATNAGIVVFFFE